MLEQKILMFKRSSVKIGKKEVSILFDKFDSSRRKNRIGWPIESKLASPNLTAISFFCAFGS